MGLCIQSKAVEKSKRVSLTQKQLLLLLYVTGLLHSMYTVVLVLLTNLMNSSQGNSQDAHISILYESKLS